MTHASKLYCVVFSGQTEPSRDIEEVKEALAQEFRLDAKTTGLLFSGKNVTVKKGLGLEAAQSLEKRFSKCGAVCRIEAEEQAPPAMGNPGLPMTRRLMSHLPQYLYITGLSLEPDIPPKSVKQVLDRFFLSKNKGILAVLDLSTDRSAENFMAFCSRGFFFHSSVFGRTSHGAVLWLDFARRSLSLKPDDLLELGPGEVLDLANIQADAFSVFELLRSIQSGLTPPEPDSSGTPAELVKAALKMFAPQDDLYLGSAIPESKAANGRKVCQIPQNEPLLALADCTVMGSAKNGLFFTSDSLYYSNDWTGKSRNGRILYTDLPGRTFSELGSFEISLGESDTLVVSGSSMKKEAFLEILETLARNLCGYGAL